jgi:hypothetical protein
LGILKENILFRKPIGGYLLILNGGLRLHLGCCFGLTGEGTLGTVMV